jgi:hypothetical protein
VQLEFSFIPFTGPNAFLMRSERILSCDPICSEHVPIVWGKCMAVSFGTHKLLLHMVNKWEIACCHENREHIIWFLTSYRAAEIVQNDYLSPA